MKTIAIIALLLLMVTISNCNTSRSTGVLPTRELTIVEPTGETMQPPGGTATQANMGVVVIQGIFDPAGEKLLQLKPVHRTRIALRPFRTSQQGSFL